MRIFDIEADFATAQYYKEIQEYSFETWYSIQHEGQSVFKDTDIRRGKAERFIGSLLSIYGLYQNDSKTLYLPSISDHEITGKISLWIQGSKHHCFEKIPVGDDELKSVIYAFEQGHILSVDKYIEIINRFAETVMSELLSQGNIEKKYDTILIR